MKFIESICETVTRALGLSSLSPWANSPAQNPVHPHGTVAAHGAHGAEKTPHGTHFDKAPKGVDPNENWYPQLPAENLFPPNVDPFEDGARGVRLLEEKLPVGEPPKVELPPGPIFAPPNASPGFTCDYTKMKGWRHTAGSGMRGSWIERPISDYDATGGIYNIFTNFDRFAPVGIVRKV